MTDQPGYTQVPNALLELLPLLPDAECRVMLVIVRKTIGWQKACDVISYSQLEAATKMSHQGVINGVEAAIKRGILKREPSGHNNGFCYEILADQVVNEVDHLKQSTKKTSQRSRPLVVNEVDRLGPQVVNEVDTQKKDLKKDKERDVAPRKTRTQRPPKEDATPTVIRTALADVCGLDLGICSREQTINVNTTAKRLHAAGEKAGKTPDETADTIRYVARWYEKNDWRGKKGDRPTPKALVDVWGAAIKARRPATNGHTPIVSDKPDQATSIKALGEAARQHLKWKD